MADVIDFDAGGYRYLPAVFQYSAGVAATTGFAIERVHFVEPLPLGEGFAAVEAHLAARGRPLAAFCACELRSPAPMTESEFLAFNRDYVRTLERWGLVRDGINPVARTNVCPFLDPPAVPSLYAFSYTVPAEPASPGSFIIAGSGEAHEGRATYRESIVRFGDTTLEGMRDKVRYVVVEMQRRLAALGFAWSDATATQAYTIHDLGPSMGSAIVGAGAARHGLTWYWCRPPVANIEFEMDVRRTSADMLK